MLLHPAVLLSSLLCLVVQHGQARHSWRRIAFPSSNSSAPLGTSTDCRQSDWPKYSQTPWSQNTHPGLFGGHSCTKEILVLLLRDSIVEKTGWKGKSWCVWQAHHVTGLMCPLFLSLKVGSLCGSNWPSVPLDLWLTVTGSYKLGDHNSSLGCDP